MSVPTENAGRIALVENVRFTPTKMCWRLHFGPLNQDQSLRSVPAEGAFEATATMAPEGIPTTDRGDF